MNNLGFVRSSYLCFIVFLAAVPLAAQEPGESLATRTLDIYVIDVEGGEATLFVSHSGESLLVDTGWSGFDGRDATRIAEAALDAGIEQIDHLVLTHFHGDHMGGIAQLAERLPIRHIVDNDVPVEVAAGADPRPGFVAYADVRSHGTHTIAHPGNTIEITGIDVQIIAAGGAVLETALAGGGKSNPYCGGFVHHGPEIASQAGYIEDSNSVGLLISYGEFRTIVMGDSNFNKEFELMCPANILGSVDLYLVSRHGTAMSGSEALVYALEPRVAIMNNGAHKGGEARTFEILRDSPSLEDVWQNHYSVVAGDDYNRPEQFIANLDTGTTVREGRSPVHMGPASWIKVSAEVNGGFTVTNGRNGYSKRYGSQD